MTDELKYFAFVASITGMIVKTQVNLYFATLRLILNNDNEIHALRNCCHCSSVRIDRIEKALLLEGIT